MRRVHGGALAVLLGCSFDEAGLGSGSTALAESESSSAATPTGSASGSAGPTADDTGATTSSSSVGAGVDSSTGIDPCAALQWWDAAWTRRRMLAVTGLGLTETLDDGVVMVRLDPTRIDYAHTRPNGGDLRFVLDEVELAYDIERWDPTATSWLWLRLPTVPAEADRPLAVAMYYGNALAPKGADAATTWAAGYVSVHHLGDLQDSTGNGHEASSSTPPTADLGFVGGAQHFDGIDDDLVVAGEPAFDFTGTLTVEALVQVDAFDKEWQAIVTKGDRAWRLHRQSFSSNVGFGTDGAGGSVSLGGTAAIDDGEWHYVAATFDGQHKHIYVDGLPDADADYTGPLAITDEPLMFGENAGHPGRQFAGRIDEVRISGSARAASYFAWHAHALADEVVTWSAEESCE